MLQTIDVGTQSVDGYQATAGVQAVAELRAAAETLRGAHILHLNATPYGGGVAEILRSEIPLLRDLGIAADWSIIRGDDRFFSVTKAIHNGLQGGTRSLTGAERAEYLRHSRENAALLDGDYDLVVVHDPQPLALRHFHGNGTSKWVWRCHIDTSAPNPSTWSFLRPYLDGFDAAVFTLGPFVPPELPVERVEIIPPAIDPESPKNIDLPIDLARRVLQWIGIEPDRPLVTQISRFDPWKDPLGVIAAFRTIKRQVPECQLALVGSMAQDDPQGWEFYQQIQAAVQDDRSIHVFTNLTGSETSRSTRFSACRTSLFRNPFARALASLCPKPCGKERPSWPAGPVASRCRCWMALAASWSTARRSAPSGRSGCSGTLSRVRNWGSVGSNWFASVFSSPAYV